MNTALGNFWHLITSTGDPSSVTYRQRHPQATIKVIYKEICTSLPDCRACWTFCFTLVSSIVWVQASISISLISFSRKKKTTKKQKKKQNKTKKQQQNNKKTTKKKKNKNNDNNNKKQSLTHWRKYWQRKYKNLKQETLIRLEPRLCIAWHCHSISERLAWAIIMWNSPRSSSGYSSTPSPLGISCGWLSGMCYKTGIWLIIDNSSFPADAMQ